MSRKDAVNFILSSVAALVLYMGVFTIGPYVETKLFPAYSKFQLASVEPYGDGQSRVVFGYTKYRQCEPQGFSWFAGELGASYRQLAFRAEGDPGPARPLGANITRHYIIDVRPDVLRDGVFAEIYSRCHPFWVTRSEIYP